MKALRLATVFSGIGAIEQAFLKQNIPFNIVFACDNGEITLKQSTEELKKEFEESNIANPQTFIKTKYKETGKTNWMKKSYFANYKISESKWHDDIRFIDGNKYLGKVDLFVGGSPCQSFSNMGKRKGLEDTRGTLFYEYARLVKEIQPKVFIYENVPGMLNHDKGNTWKVIKNVFESLGYEIYFKLLNASHYGIPQNRNRLYVVGFKTGVKKFVFPEGQELTKTMFDFLEDNVDKKYYFKFKGFRFVTSNKSRARVNQNVIRTQKANQQFNWNGDFVFIPVSKVTDKTIFERAYVGKYEGIEGVARKLTPRECLRLMGFSDKFKIVVPDVHMYRQSGNSIVVNVFENILNQILKTGVYKND